MKAKIIPHGEVTLDTRFPENNPDNPRYKRRLLAEGDSWFSMGSVPFENVLLELDFPERTIVVNIAEPGDEIVKMARPDRVKIFRQLVAVKKFAFDWHAILLSGGGNDLIERAGDILRAGDTADACINQAELRRCMKDIADAYRALGAIRDADKSPNAGKPIITHTYDLPTPRDSPALFFGSRIRGPWLMPPMVQKGIDPALWNPIADRLINALAETILGLATGKNAIPNFHPVDTRNAIIRAEPGTTKKSGDWRNEIHPSKEGYGKVAAKLAALVPAL
jgi:hypothetical protein